MLRTSCPVQRAKRWCSQTPPRRRTPYMRCVHPHLLHEGACHSYAAWHLEAQSTDTHHCSFAVLAVSLLQLCAGCMQEICGTAVSCVLLPHGSSPVAFRARDTALSAFDRLEAGVLICSDLVARGLDFQNVGLVVRYDLPVILTNDGPVTDTHRWSQHSRPLRQCLHSPGQDRLQQLCALLLCGFSE